MGMYDDLNASGLIGGAAEGFVQGLEKGYDRRYREMEMNAKAESREQDRKRQAFMDALEARSKGFKVPDGGNMYDTPASALEYDPEYLQMQKDKASFGALFDPRGTKEAQAQAAKYDLQKKALDAQQASKGHKLPPDKVISMQEGQQLPTALADLGGSIEQNKDLFGPVAGRMGAMNPYDTRAQTLDAQLRTYSQKVGRYLEGGVLRKEDEEKYRKMLPQLTDTLDVAKNKLAIVQDMLAKKHNADTEAMKNQSYDTAGLSPVAAPELPKGLGKVKTGLVGAGPKGLVKDAAPATPPGKVKVSNGKETLMIDAADLKAAEKDGYKRAQ